MSPYVRPDLKEIYNLLDQHSALIVHFSGTPKGGGSNFEHIYPEDLREVISGSCNGGLSCSTIMPQDQFSDLRLANATGCIGVILGLQSGQSILDAHPRDCGTYVEKGVRLVPHARDLTIEDLAVTISERDRHSYNEWVICNYVVLGIFAASPFNVWAMVMPSEPPDMPDYLRATEPVGDIVKTCLPDIISAFPGQRIFSFDNGQLVMMRDGTSSPVEHATLYRP